MNKDIIYIAGLYHSGSTLLDQYLGSKNNIVGLGEIYKYIKDGPEEKCTCGKNTDDCELWSKLIIPKDKLSTNFEENYKKIIEVTSNQFRGIKYILDSSKCHPYSREPSYKNFRGLVYFTKYYPHKLKIIHVYRDPRGWVSGIMRREKRSKRNFLCSILFRSFLMKAIRYIQWIYMHSLIRKFIKENNLDSINISYEELCLDTPSTLKKISDFLQIDLNIDKLNLKSTNSHICVGNPSRFNNLDKPKIKYDVRWLKEKFSFVDYIFSNILKTKIIKYIYK